MGYARGIKWSEEKIKSEILAVMEKANLKTMPTQKILKEVTGNSRLTTAISRYGGIIKFANDMGIEHMGRETELGREYEKICLCCLYSHKWPDHSTITWPLPVISNILI